MNAETMSNMWKKIGYADQGCAENNIMSISISDTWSDMLTPILADDELENPKTAFTWCKVDLPLLSQYFDWAANSPMSKAVLQGKIHR
eukprot:2012856-Ditylum_brightwellii.AAC.1